MQAVTFQGKKNVKYETVAEPILEQPTDAIVKVHLAGICGSDLHPYHEREKGLDAGTVMGHEFVGEIVECGKDVRRFKAGQRVCCPFTTNCGVCYYCRIGLTCRCVHGQLFGWRSQGAGLHGGQAEYVRVPLADTTLLEIPENVSLPAALLLGDVLSTGFFCAENAGVAAGHTCAVLGCGPVGLMAVIAARELGAGQLFAIDEVPERLQLAEKFGATPVNFQLHPPQEIIEAATEGRGADTVLEVVGNAAAARAAFELIRSGGVISTVGVHTETDMAFSPGQAYDKNLTYKNGRCPARYYMEKLLPLLQKEAYEFTAVITHHLPLANGAKGYQLFDEKKDRCIKAVLHI